MSEDVFCSHSGHSEKDGVQDAMYMHSLPAAHSRLAVPTPLPIAGDRRVLRFRVLILVVATRSFMSFSAR